MKFNSEAEATAFALKVCDYLGPGWGIHVHENMGWYCKIQKGSISVTPRPLYRDDDLSRLSAPLFGCRFGVLIGDVNSPGTGWVFGSRHERPPGHTNPKEAVRIAVGIAGRAHQSHVDSINSAREVVAEWHNETELLADESQNAPWWERLLRSAGILN